MTHQARLELERRRREELAEPPCNSAHVSLGGIVTVRDRSGLLRAAKLDEGDLLRLEREAREARLALESRALRRAS